MSERRGKNDTKTPNAPASPRALGEAWHLLGYLRPYRGKLFVAIVCLIVGGLLSLAVPYLGGKLVEASLLGPPGPAPRDWQQDVNRVGLTLVLTLALQAAVSFLRTVWSVEVGERALADLRRDIYTRLVRLPMEFHEARRVGELAGRFSADLTGIRQALIGGVSEFLRQSVLLIGGVTVLAFTSLRLTAVMLFSVPVLMLITVAFRKVIRFSARDVQDRLAESNVAVEQTLQNIPGVKAFANEPFEERRYRQTVDVYVRSALRGAFLEGAFNSFVVFALFGSIVLVLWFGARLVLAGEMSAGDLTRFMMLTVFVGGAVGSFADLYTQLQRMLGASQRVRELMCETPEPSDGAPVGKRLRGDVRFENVHFRYPSRPEATVLNGVSLVARAGQRIALVGPSGAGKSTLVSLLLRFYEPDAGRILIDGRDARDYDLRALRSQVAVVPQDIVLFGGSIADNIAYGRPGATQTEIEEAARQANAHEFIAALPDGYQTRVGERGVQLSGGQRQRVAIARAILRDPAILLLDEATSSLDSESESLVLEALDRLMKGRTAIVIAHRLSTIRNADQIMVLKEGTVVESGRHAELMRCPDGVYRKLSLLQQDRRAGQVRSRRRREKRALNQPSGA